MKWYPWLNQPYRQLVNQIQAGRGHHALLIHALPGMGDDALVWALSRWLMCQQREELKSCGHCHACTLMQAHTHPDWYSLAAEKNKRVLGIDAIRDISEKLYHHAQQGGAKVVWLPDANLLTEAAANALLKTLEEPPQHCWFMLCSAQPDALLATLRSRCQRVYLAAPPEAQSLAWLQKQGITRTVEGITALHLSAGAPAAALSLLDEKTWHARRALYDALPQALAHDMLSLLPLLNHDDVVQRIDWLCTLLVDAWKWQQDSSQFITNRDSEALIADMAMRLPGSALDHSLRDWISCRGRLLTVVAVNRELVLTDRLLAWEQMLQTAFVA